MLLAKSVLGCSMRPVALTRKDDKFGIDEHAGENRMVERVP